MASCQSAADLFGQHSPEDAAVIPPPADVRFALQQKTEARSYTNV
jgi:hypothetical protein